MIKKSLIGKIIEIPKVNSTSLQRVRINSVIRTWKRLKTSQKNPNKSGLISTKR